MDCKLHQVVLNRQTFCFYISAIHSATFSSNLVSDTLYSADVNSQIFQSVDSSLFLRLQFGMLLHRCFSYSVHTQTIPPSPLVLKHLKNLQCAPRLLLKLIAQWNTSLICRQKNCSRVKTLNQHAGSGPAPTNQFLRNHFIECLNICLTHFSRIKETCDYIFIYTTRRHKKKNTRPGSDKSIFYTLI